MINQIPESRFRSTDPSALGAKLFAEHRIEPLELTEGAISVEAHDAAIDRRRFRDIDHGFPGASLTLSGPRVIYNVPYTGDPQLFLRPSHWNIGVPRAVHDQNELRFVYEVPSSEVAETRADFAKQYVTWSGQQIGQYNVELRRVIEAGVDARGSRLAEADEGLATLG